MARHRRTRLTVTVNHEGEVKVVTCDECVDPTEAVRLLRSVVDHLMPMAHPDEVLVPKDSCEADHPTRHLQCWGSYGHEGPHYVGGADGSKHYWKD